MKKIILTICGGAMCLTTVLAQNANDMLLYAQQFSGGTARSMSMGGAFGALGGDVSTLSTNPAGLGVYRQKNDFMVSFGPSFGKTESILGNDRREERNNSFPLYNLGYQHTWSFGRERGLKSISFGMAYNKLSDFSQSAYVDSEVGSSMISDFVYALNNGEWSEEDKQVYADPCYDTYAIWNDDTGYAVSDYPATGSYTQQMRRTVSNSGRIGEFSFALGANIGDKLFIGASLGLQDFSYHENYVHRETPNFYDDKVDPLRCLYEYEFSQSYDVSGTGVNGKFGVIYRPINLIRIGLAVHTPTRFSLKRQIITDMDAKYNAEVGDDEYGYDTEWWTVDRPIFEMPKLTAVTPWRYNVSLASVIGSFAIVSLEGEYLDYSTAKYRPFSKYAIPDNDINGDISRDYQSTFNLKGGAEFRLGPVSLRGGASYYGSPFKSGVGVYDGSTFSYSGGVGFRGKSFYADAAYVYTGYPRQGYSLYRDDPASDRWLDAALQRTQHQIVFTLGFRW